ncbi:MAG: hypothetical protein D6795_18995, partial [Deltaproteobacteria bacterium]
MRVSLALFLFLLPAVARAAEASPIIRRIEFTGVDAAEIPRLRASIPIAEGDPLQRWQVTKSVKLIYLQGNHAQVEAGIEPAGEGVLLRFSVTQRSWIAEIAFTGNETIPDGALKRLLDVEEGDDLLPDLLERQRRKIIEAFQRRGYPDVAVELRSAPIGSGGVRVTFLVREHSPRILERIVLTGSLGLPEGEIRRVIGLKPGDRLDEERLAEGLDTLQALLQAKGFLEAAIPPPRIVASGEGRASLTLLIQAGKRIHLQFVGNRAFPPKRLVESLALERNPTITSWSLGALEGRLEKFYRTKGYPFCTVTALLNEDA